MACATKMQTLLQTAYAVRILVLSARFRRGLPESAEAARRLGVKKVRPGPFTREELLLVVRASLEERVMQAVALRYALAPTCILLAVLVYLSPAGRTLSLAGLFVFAVLAAAWFGGAGPGLVAARCQRAGQRTGGRSPFASESNARPSGDTIGGFAHIFVHLGCRVGSWPSVHIR
jgi:hypothetical protein